MSRSPSHNKNKKNHHQGVLLKSGETKKQSKLTDFFTASAEKKKKAPQTGLAASIETQEQTKSVEQPTAAAAAAAKPERTPSVPPPSPGASSRKHVSQPTLPEAQRQSSSSSSSTLASAKTNPSTPTSSNNTSTTLPSTPAKKRQSLPSSSVSSTNKKHKRRPYPDLQLHPTTPPPRKQRDNSTSMKHGRSPSSKSKYNSPVVDLTQDSGDANSNHRKNASKLGSSPEAPIYVHDDKPNEKWPQGRRRRRRQLQQQNRLHMSSTSTSSLSSTSASKKQDVINLEEENDVVNNSNKSIEDLVTKLKSSSTTTTAAAPLVDMTTPVLPPTPPRMERKSPPPVAVTVGSSSGNSNTSGSSTSSTTQATEEEEIIPTPTASACTKPTAPNSQHQPSASTSLSVNQTKPVLLQSSGGTSSKSSPPDTVLPITATSNSSNSSRSAKQNDASVKKTPSEMDMPVVPSKNAFISQKKSPRKEKKSSPRKDKHSPSKVLDISEKVVLFQKSSPSSASPRRDKPTPSKGVDIADKVSLFRKNSPSPPKRKPASSSSTATTTTTSVKPSPLKQRPPPTPQRFAEPLSVGTRCAVYQDITRRRGATRKNSFGFATLSTWEAGIVSKVTAIPKQDKNVTNRVQVIMDSCGHASKPVTVVWTNDASSKVQRLVPLPDGSEQLEMNPSICRVPAPTDLSVGDAVLAWYQKWPGGLNFTGRVAKVDGDRCSVAYDDGDWEDDIPYKQKSPSVVLTRISKGWEEPQWLEGVKLSSLRPRKSRTEVTSTVQRCEPGGSVWLKFAHQRGEKKSSYLPIASLAMQEAKGRAKSCVSWLDADESENTGDVNSPSGDSVLPSLESSFESRNDSSFQLSPESLATHTSNFSDQDTPPKKTGKRNAGPNKQTLPNNKKAKTGTASQPPKGRSTRKRTEREDLAAKNRTDSHDGDEPALKSEAGRKKTRTTASAARNRHVVCVAEPPVATAFQWKWPPSYLTLSQASTDDGIAPIRSRMSAPFAQSVERSWNSCESETAAAVMSHVQVHNGMEPPVQLQRAMNVLILKGPRAGQSNPIFFPDCQRMDLAHDVVQGVTVSWFDFWEQMESLLYCVVGDDRRTNRFAIQRIATSAHAKSILAKRFLETVPESYPCAPQTWLTEIRQHSKGPRAAFQDAINTFVSLWTLCGHFYLNPKPQMDEISPDLQVFVQHNSRKLLQDLAKVLSFAGQLYAMEEDQDAKALAYFLGGRVEGLLESFSPPDEFCISLHPDEYKEKMKLRMILDLDSLVLPGVRPLLASHMGLAVEYYQIFS